jgi:DNA-binding beta-propeller fold protein YncE
VGGYLSDVEMTQPWSIAVAPDGNVFVANTWAHNIIKLDADLNEIKRWGSGGQVEAGGDPFRLFGPRDIAVAPNGNVLVTDTGNHRVLEYTSEGDFVRQFGSRGESGAPLEFQEPTGIEVSDAGDIYIADLFNKRIVALAQDLSLKSTIRVDAWDTVAAGRGTLDKSYMALLPDGRLLATDPANKTVLTFAPDGALLATYEVPAEGTQAFARPVGIATDGVSVWVSDSAGHVVRKIPLSEIVP